jgi:peptidoglycan/LPS O-acetylase OafA/YrhL
VGLMRFLLALSVAVSHSGGPFQVFNSRYAVQTFYVASGFLIAMILAQKYQHSKWLFYSNRAARIFVPYWIVLLPTVAFCAWKQVGFWANISRVDQLFDFGTWAYVVLTNLFLLGQDAGLFLGWTADSQLYFTSKFYESSTAVWGFQAIPQAWTVSLELCFYLLAPFVLRSNTVTLVCLCVLTFLMRVFAFEGGLAGDPWTYRFFPFEFGYFLLGALAYRASTVKRVRVAIDWSPRLIPALACMIVLGVLIGWGRSAWITSISSFTTYYGQPIGLFVLIALGCPYFFDSPLAIGGIAG